MKRSGWYGDNWRHSLAAKGIKSKYFAPKVVTEMRSPDATVSAPKQTTTPKRKNTATASERRERELRAQQRVQTLREQIAREQEPSQKLLRQLSSGDLSVLSDPKVNEFSPADRAALTAEANKQAVEFAISGVEVPGELQGVISKETRNRVNAIKRQQRAETRGPAASVAGAVGLRTLEGAEAGARAFGRTGLKAIEETATTGGVLAADALTKTGAAGTAASIAAKDAQFKNATSSLQKRSSLYDSLGDDGRGIGLFPDISDNVFLGGDGDPGIGKLKDNGAFDFLSEPASDTSPLSSAIVPREKFKGVDFGMGTEGGPVRTFADQVSDKVESLWSNKRELGMVDKAPLKKGQRAFENGDREKLIEAINEQEFQIKQQESRWRLVNQTRAQVESNANHEAALNKKQGAFGGIFQSSGGAQIAEQTKKINEVTKSVKQGADEARSRAQVLRGNLQRLDATVPFDESVPKEDVKLFKKEFSFADLLKQRGAANEGQ